MWCDSITRVVSLEIPRLSIGSWLGLECYTARISIQLESVLPGVRIAKVSESVESDCRRMTLSTISSRNSIRDPEISPHRLFPRD